MSDRYEFIDAEYAGTAADGGPAPTITCMCTWLGVSKSGFYEWRSRPDSATAERRKELALIIKKIFDDSDSAYGYDTVSRLMNSAHARRRARHPSSDQLSRTPAGARSWL